MDRAKDLPPPLTATLGEPPRHVPANPSSHSTKGASSTGLSHLGTYKQVKNRREKNIRLAHSGT